jgi:hypothetical protein
VFKLTLGDSRSITKLIKPMVRVLVIEKFLPTMLRGINQSLLDV